MAKREPIPDFPVHFSPGRQWLGLLYFYLTVTAVASILIGAHQWTRTSAPTPGTPSTAWDTYRFNKE